MNAIRDAILVWIVTSVALYYMALFANALLHPTSCCWT